MIDRRIKFRHIQSFVEIVRQRSLKRAAETLFVTQPAISKTLKELEDILGTPLLTRSRAGIALTRQGEVFLHFAERSLVTLQQGFDEIEQLGRGGSTAFTVGALPSVAARLMPQVTHEFFARAPEVTLRIIDGPHAYLIDLLRRGQIDLVIGRMGPPETMQGISFTQLYNEHLDFVVRPGHPLLDAPDIRRIGDWPVIYPPEGAAIRALVERLLIAQGVGVPPRRLETVSGAFGRNYVPTSDAIWIISAGVVAKEVQEGRLARLPFDTAMSIGPVGMVTRPETTPPPAEEIFRLAVTAAIETLGI
ncbi:pca operon transcription factor PcaQ [Salipiger bermudensis]|uniref:pca operon transcription factor PcaQ n=1 Tax=Salipiger bermudensis TaxID=344736 RepID=UPI001C99151C|nr:pca operon transcription factor PcaQ [Salipiger bermudensis]MBY6006578.1 pca operon transcription factor PcaQ [Salipiger bermudensis]